MAVIRTALILVLQDIRQRPYTFIVRRLKDFSFRTQRTVGRFIAESFYVPCSALSIDHVNPEVRR